VTPKIRVEKLQEGLLAKRFGKRILFCHEVGSTNDWAKELAKLGAVEGTVAVVEVQTAGHGRLGRKWVSPEGGLWFSVILRPRQHPLEAAGLVFVAGLAAADVLHDVYGLVVETKWPNDVLASGRKLCGILCEMSTTGEKVGFAVIGIGVNVNFEVKEVFPKSLASTATSVKDELGRAIRLEELLRALLERLESVYDLLSERGLPAVIEKWKKYASFLGQKIEVTSGSEKSRGLALDVDGDGALLLKLDDGTVKRVHVGDVSLRRE
jgi:BirA family biotin operon repressor/biotin-[acetyl-CoA-carboxylase] ligase